jgi:hypothetical protein
MTARCFLVFHRHMGQGPGTVEPSGFVLEKLRPLAEDAMRSGSTVHVIHERISRFPMSRELVQRFEEVLRTPKAMRNMKALDREIREITKREFARADVGEASEGFDRRMAPEIEFILSVNSQRTWTIKNHLNFYPFEAVVEHTASLVHGERAVSALSANDIPGYVNETVADYEASAKSIRLRDADLVRQVDEMRSSSPDEVIFIMRGLTHGYMTNLFSEKGIDFVAENEPDAPAFDGDALRLLLTTGLTRGDKERFALLQLFFADFFVDGKLDKNDPQVREAARKKALETYERLASG